MNNLLQTILNILQNLLGGGAASADKPDTPAPQPGTSASVPTQEDPGSGGGAATMTDTISHALVLPDADFRAWYEATRAYTTHFKRVVVVRSPAGNNLNRYKTITAIRNGRTWFNSDPVAHIRRAYPNVVTVDVIEATTPAALQPQLVGRVQNNTRLGNQTDTRFTLDWPTDSFTLRIVREFDVPMGGGKYHEGIDLAADPGTVVRSACNGRVFSITADGGTLGYGNYVQVQAEAQDGTDYLITYTQLADIQVQDGQQLAEGDILGVCASDWGIKLVVQESGVNTGSRYTMPGAVDPARLLYVDGIRLHTTAPGGLNIRKGRGTEYEKVGLMAEEDTAETLEKHGITIRKTQTTPDDNQWLNVDTSAGVTGFGAAWFLEARSPRSVAITNTALNGINLDVRHPLGRPNPARLNAMTYARLAYDVSMGRGNQDLGKAYDLYAPYIEALNRAGKKVILVYTHQTYGEGVGYIWENMNSSRWEELAARLSDFLRVISKQYRGQVAAHQVWNEQDAAPGSEAAVSMPSADYATILGRSIQALRAADPATPIITGGHTRGPQLGAQYARQTLAALPGNLRPDGIAAHPYGRGTGAVPKYEQFGHIDETVREYSQVMPGKRIWLTEWGVLNANSEPAEDMTQYATSFLARIRTKHADKVAATVWYAWAEGMHNGYGLVNKADQPREPLYSAYTRIR